MWEYNKTNELYHFGKLGMKWGVRRYKNSDGTLNTKGVKKVKSYDKRISNNKKTIETSKSEIKDLKKHGMNSKTVDKIYKQDKLNKEDADFFGEKYTSKMPKLITKTDAKGNIKEIYGLDNYKLRDFLDTSIQDRQENIEIANHTITKLEKKKAALLN